VLKSKPDLPRPGLDQARLDHVSNVTVTHYERSAEDFRDGTLDHDVSQNYAALLEAIEGEGPFSVLDLGCGPGRDLHYF